MRAYLTALVVGIVLNVISILASKERAKDIVSKTVFGMERTLIYAALMVAFSCCIIAMFCVFSVPESKVHHRDFLVPTVIGLMAVGCATIWALYRVELGKDVLYFRLLGKRSIRYGEINNIRDIRNQGSPRIVLEANGGSKINLWSNLLGHDVLVKGLRDRCSL